ncbi:MAG: molecular chaperone DnaJ [Candidatus Cloacimonadota bacterium]|nr:MAG: molecular chaperone DnaJ [Candidatus Cloacimonadota bacterium]PIE77798.1 MAG: molecular chaperone DnaJ [Candidatus Delongbacteria bacterium]
MSKKDYYELLGVSRDADKNTIKKAYKKLALKYHPDKNRDDPSAEEKFKEVAEAYSVLSDENKRARYDRFGHDGLSGAGGGGFSGFGGFDAESIFESFFGGGGSRSRRSGPASGSNLKIYVDMSLEEISSGIKKKIKIKKYVKCSSCSGSGAESSSSIKSCPNCNGSGEVRMVQNSLFGQVVNVTSCPKCNGTGKQIINKCSSCSGEGRVRDTETIEFDIPAGVSEGQYLTIRGKGNAGRNGGGNGDIIAVIREKDHKYFHRDDENIFYDLKLSISQAVLGADIEVPTIEGRVKVKIQAGTQPGKLLKLGGKGLPRLNGYGRGDQIVRINVWIPTNISSETRKKFEELDQLSETKPQPEEKGFFAKVKDFFHGL